MALRQAYKFMTTQFIIHPLGSDNYVEITCDINIKETTYEVSYKYRFSEKIDTVEKEISILKILELYDNDAMDPYEGDIIYKNSLSEHLIKYLCMSDEDLSKVSGNVHYENYRLSIIKSIQLLWD